jgi:hypothetical protein
VDGAHLCYRDGGRAASPACRPNWHVADSREAQGRVPDLFGNVTHDGPTGHHDPSELIIRRPKYVCPPFDKVPGWSQNGTLGLLSAVDR